MSIKKLVVTYLGIVLLFITVSCKKDPARTEETGAGKGVVKGTVYSPNGDHPIAAATVEVVVGGEKITKEADKVGVFLIELPAGQHHLKFYAGAGARLALQKEITVVAGQTIELPANQTALTYTGKIAYVTGMFDSIQELLAEMGIQATRLTKEDLEDYDKIKQYDLLMLNCGGSDADFEKIGINLDRFLKEGHSMYVSDWAIQDLTGLYDGHSFISESLLTWNQGGDAKTIEGSILYDPFKKALGKNTLNIVYDQPNFVNIEAYAANDSRFKVLVSHPQQGPLALNIQWGPSKLSAAGTRYGGNIIYTTFHNEPGLTPEVRAVLRQMILQL